MLTPDAPFGQPAFALSADQIATVLDLVCRGSQEAQRDITPGMLEVPVTIVVRKAMRRVKQTLERFPIRLTISRIGQVCSAFGSGDHGQRRGDGRA